MMLDIAIGLLVFAAVGFMLEGAAWLIVTPLTRRQRTIARLLEG